jgi:hypothetical protein
VSVVFQGIPTANDPRTAETYPGLDATQSVIVELPVLMGESKLRSQSAAEKQLFDYAAAFSREISPAMRFLVFTLRRRGLEVAMFKFAPGGGTKLDTMPFGGGSTWAPVYEPAVHDAMCAFTAEVQSSWNVHGLCWAYEG